MARLMVSAGIDWPLASDTALRSLGLPPASPPPMRAATVISLMSLVKSFPRFASSAPFLCLMVAHFEWPLMIWHLAWGEATPLTERRDGSESKNGRQGRSGQRAQ